VASSHLRVGSFQYARASGDVSLLRRLADYAISRHYRAAADSPQPYVALLEAVIAAQASTVAQWMMVGFVHGVMNTDNMAVSGETLDYGPCAFMEAYDPSAVYSSIDAGARYAYGNQPLIAEWNLARLAEALLPLLDEDSHQAVEQAKESLSNYRRRYNVAWTNGMRAKLGLPESVEDTVVSSLAGDLLDLLYKEKLDYTSFLRTLAAVARRNREPAVERLVDEASFDDWSKRWLAFNPDAGGMDAVNPIYLPRNHLVEAALAAATGGDLDPLFTLLAAVSAPYQERAGLEAFAEPAPATFGPYRTFCGT
jgi:uncharacterized protein YdiU (UPF0061 family)